MASVFERLKAYFDKSDSNYLLSLNSREVSDLGISSTDIGVLAAGPTDTGPRMEAMARAHGLTSSALRRERWREVDMAKRCSQCKSRRVCNKFLAGKDGNLNPDDFCPNAHEFAELAST